MTADLTRAEINDLLGTLSHVYETHPIPMLAVQAITQLLAQLDAAESKLALHESENVTRGLLIDRLQARADAAAGQMREQCASVAKNVADQSADAALTGLPENARQREAMEAAATNIFHRITALPLHEEPNNGNV